MMATLGGDMSSRDELVCRSGINVWWGSLGGDWTGICSVACSSRNREIVSSG